MDIIDISVQYCPNPDCPDYGKAGSDNIGIHSRKEKRFICRTCGKTFAATYGTPLYRRHLDHQLIAWIISLLSNGCPPQAIVATFEVDPRTVEDLWRASGQHCQQVHEEKIQKGQLALGQVQTDELRHKIQGAVLWIAMAIAVPTRLWLGAAVSLHRDKALILRLVEKVKAAAARCRSLLLCFDGLSAYISTCRQVFRTPVHTGKPGRPRLVPWPDVHLGQVIKQYAQRRVVGVERRVVQGSAAIVAQLLRATQNGGVLNTAFIERLIATFRSRLALRVRRTRHLARKAERVEWALYLVGAVYNFCTYHDALRQPLYIVYRHRPVRRWVERTPAMAAGPTDHRWTVLELLMYKVPPAVPHKAGG